MNFINKMFSDLTIRNRYCLYKSNLSDHGELWCELATNPSLSREVANVATLWELNW